MLNCFLNLIYPNVCGVCGQISKDSLCRKCENQIKPYEINLIKKYKKKSMNESMHIFKYDGVIRQKIIQYKFLNKPYLYKTFSKIILKNKKVCGFLKKYDIIIPVPIHEKRKKDRGYNQTELIAKYISKQLNIYIEKNALLKQKNTISQSELRKKERENNVKNAFIIKDSKRIENKKILLFDDIYTTGNTVKECCKVLKKAGAKQIGVLTIAKD